MLQYCLKLQNVSPSLKGAERLISTLKALGYKTAILSGGFQYFAEYLQEKLGIDEVHANVNVEVLSFS